MKKFIITMDTTGELDIRLSNCVELHSELMPSRKSYTASLFSRREPQPEVNCLGGGHFHIDGKDLYLYGISEDYGRASMQNCQDALKNQLSSWSDFNYYYSDVEECPLDLDEVKRGNITKL